MKTDLKLFARKALALIIATTMSFPQAALAGDNDLRVYEADSSVMGLAQKEEANRKIKEKDTRDKIETDSYIMALKASLLSEDKILYQISLDKKEGVNSEDINLRLSPLPNSSIKDLNLVSARGKVNDRLDDIDLEEEMLGTDIKTLSLKSQAYDEIVIEVEADIRQAIDSRPYDLLVGLDDGKEYKAHTYSIKAKKEIEIKEDKTIESLGLELNEEESSKLKGEIENKDLAKLFKNDQVLSWTDYLVNETNQIREETYTFKLDDKQDTKDSKISIDYYEDTKDGYVLKKEFSQSIDFAEKINFEIPAHHLVKLNLKTKIDANNKETKTYKLNQAQVKNPAYEKTGDESSDDDDEAGEADKKEAEQKKEVKSEDKKDLREDLKDSKIVVEDSNGEEIQVEVKEKTSEEDDSVSALSLNKDSLINRLSAEDKLSVEIKASIEKLTEDLESYNRGKISDQELKDFTKMLAANEGIEKEDLKDYIESILAGLNKETNKAANLNIDEIIAYAYSEKDQAEIKVDDNKTQEPKEEKAEKPAEKEETLDKEEENTEDKTESDSKEELQRENKEKPSLDKEEIEEKTKAFDEDLANLKDEAAKEEDKTGIFEGLKSLVGQTDLKKADKELKAALADESKGLEEIQGLLDSFEDKYDLSRTDQAKLMDDNADSIRALVENDRDQNFRPHIFAATGKGLNLDGKKFHIITRFDTSTALGPIKKGQYFNIHLDDKLTVKDESKLGPIKDSNGEIIATPEYVPGSNTIKYTIAKDIPNNLQIPLDIPVDYNNPSKIKLDDDGTFTVVNQVSGLGVRAPKDLVPQKVDKNGNPTGSIIEPGRDEVTQVIEPDDENYKVTLDASANPVIKDKKIEGYNWTFRITSDTDLKSLGYKANFTTVKGSGLGEITGVKIDGKSVDLESQLNQNHELGIVSSKHHDLQESRTDITYDFYTGATEKQSSYLLDFSIALTEKGKVGAKRFIVEGAYTEEQISEVTPNRVGINNRTTILGEFRTEDTAQWTVTDAVSTGDNKDGNGNSNPTKLPLETRTIDSKQEYKGSTGRSAVYYLDPTDGKMKQDTRYSRTDLSKLPDRYTLPSEAQKVGTIAVYQFDTNLKEKSVDGYSLSGVNINKYQPIKIKQTWAGIDSNKKMPNQTIKVRDSKGNKISEDVSVSEGQTGVADREIDLPSVKTWNIKTKENQDGWTDTIKERINPVIVQELPGQRTIDGKTYTYKEKYNYYSLDDGAYHIYNVMSESTNEKDADFTIIKTDRNDHSKRLAGAVFTLQSARETIELETDANGRASFKNISPGTYTLTENEAPSGYKLDQNPKQITVYNDGTVSVSGSNISMQGGQIPTKTARHNYYPSYPSYMNAMHYGKIGQNGNIEFYIYLKPEANGNDGGTNKNTRLNLNLAGGGKIDSVEVIDVNPNNRYSVRSQMQNQTARNVNGNNLIKVVSQGTETITGKDNKYDDYTGRTGYQIKFPSSRFNGDWGFLVKVKASGASSTSTVSYDWLTDNASTQNEARIQESIGLSTAADNADGVIINIGNEEFPKSPVEVTKVKENGIDALTGATFALMDSKNNTIAHAKTGYDEKNLGLASFGNLSPGNYTIEESNPPNGYKKSNVVFDVDVAEDGKVTYKARFKDGNGTPIHGVDYFLEEIEIDDQLGKAEVTNVEQSMTLQEKQNQPDDGRLGGLEGIWEAYGIESYRYYGSYSFANARKGGKFKIQFDPNLDFKRYVYEIPDLKDSNGKLLAKPYFNYDTNLLTYVFEQDIEQAQAAIEIIGIIPDKYYATQTDKDYGYNFNITVDPDNPDVARMQPKQTYPNRQTTKSTNNKLRVNIKTDYYAYDSQGGAGPLTSEYISDIYTDENGQIYLKAVSYYNPTNMSSGPRKIRLDWISMKKPRPGLEYYKAEGLPAFEFDSLNVYKVTGDQSRKQRLMPLSYGIRPEQDTSDYYKVYSKYNVNPKHGFSESSGDVTVSYRPEYLKSSEGLLDYAHEKHPLEISLPKVNAKEGYVMVQTFKVTDEKRFKDLWSGYYLSNGSRQTGSYQKGNYNWAIGSGNGKEIPRFYSQRVKLVNKKYEPGSFKIKKTNEADDKPLQGAVFELRNEEGDVMNRFSDSDGVVEYKDLEPGIYTLQEIQPPTNFIKSNKRWQVIVYDTGDVVIREIGLGGTEYEGKNTIVIPVTNRPAGENFRVYKKDSEGQVLQGAKFKITKPDNSSFSEEKESNERGIVEFEKLTNGTYIIEEIEAPEGYKKLDKKWVLVIDENGKKVYNYREKSTGESDLNSIIEKPNIKWVDVAGRSLDGWGLYDNRRTDWTGNYPVPFKMGTRIVAINANDKYVIQRYVINPEAKSIAKTIATIHRQELNDPNMDWYNEQGVADEDYQIFTLDKEVTGEIADIRLGEYNPTNITDKVKTSTDKTRYGEPARLKLEFPATNKPIVVDIKVPYKYANAGVGTGMDWTENGTTYWKADFYERVNIIKETSPVLEQSDGIQGSYISDDFLDVENEAKTYGFKIKKVKDEETDTIVQGAKFKLTGLDESKEEREMTTGQDGIIYFDKLKPGKYKLEESKPAPGYEKSNVIWTVRVAKDGKVYIKENGTGSVFEPNAEIIIQDPNDPAPVAPKSLFRSPMRVDLLESASEANSGLEIGDVLADIRNPLRAGDGWEVVDNASSTQPTTRQDVSDSGFGQLIETKIIEIDKENNRYKQVFIYKEGFAKKNRNIKFHRAYDNYNIKPNEVTTRVFQVPNGTSLANINESSDIDLIPGKTDISKNIRFTQEGTKKIQTTNVNTRYPGTILIEVETNYIENQPIGLGSNYNFNTTGQYGNKCWLEKSYTNEANVPVIKPTVYRTITFDGNGGTWHMSPVTVEDGIVYELPGSSFIAPDGKEFDGWLVNRQKKNPGDKIVVTSDLTITAQWRQKAPEQVTVSFIPGEGSGTMQDKKVNLGSNYQLPANGFIAPTGKEFKAWSVNGVEYQPGAIIQVKADTTLTALWKMKAPTTYNIIVQNPQEGGMVFAEPTSATAGTEITLTVTPNKGYEIQSVTMNGQVLTADTDGKYKFEMPAAEATVSAIFKQKEDKPEDGEEEIPSDGFAQITNRQTGIELKIYKKSSLDAALKGAIFELKKTDDDYTVDDTSFGTVIGVSDEKGNVRFEDENDNPVKLQVGKYLLTETKAPAGFKKPPAPWKLEVVEEGGKLVIKQSGPKHSSTSYLSSDGAKAGDNLSTDETIKYKSIIKNIDPVNKTFIQRIYIDTRGYKGSDKINVQITPTTKREEIDTPGAPPKTTSGGVKTAYRTTYKVSNPAADLKPDDVLDDYDLRKSNVSVVNTARWRPFDWGFDEDQINLSNDGVYFIDIEGFYDDNIVDLEEIELKVDFYGGERVFAQRTYDKTTNQLGWTIDKDIGVDEDGNQVKRDAAYLLGMVALKDLYQHHNGAPAANTWYNSNPDNGKYDIYLRKGAYVNGTYYDAGRIVLANDPNNPNNPLNITPIQSSIVKADIKDLYSSDNISNVPQEGMTITNEDETYNITFSKHSKEQDDPAKEDFNNNRLEGAVFKLEKKEGSFWYDVDESYVASAFNGYFGFRKLEPGRYRLIEVTPPEGYKPIEGPLLEFTIKQLDTSSDKILNPKTQEEFNLIDLTIIDPYNQKKIVLEDAKAKLKEDPEDKIYDFKNLVADEKFDLDTVIILSEVKENGKAKEITLKEASFIDPELDEPMGRIISGAQGFITLEYAPGDYVSEYGKAGSSGGSLVDYVTSATAKNMGKILNEKPGRGRVTIKKIDENGGAIGLTMDSEGKLTVGAKFEATRISAKKDGKGKPIDEAKYSGTVDENGQLVIDGLPIGNYELREVENPSGYINTGQIWHFTVGGKELDPYAGEIARTGNDLTSLISLEKSDLTVVRPNEEDKTITEDSEGNNIIRPHLGQSLEFDNSFKFNSNVKIQPGDYFVVKLSDNIDLDGVKTGGAGNLDIFADGVGTIAKADYDKQRGTITYTFTQYAEQYNLINFENKLAAHITFSMVRNSAQTKVGLSVGEISKLHDIEVKYDLDTVERYHDNSTVNLASKIVEYNTNTGEFVHYFYVNRDRSYNAKDMYFEYSPSLDVENLQFTYYRLRNNSDYYINQSMPESFAVKEYDNNLYRAGGSSPQSVSANETMTRNIGNLGPNGSMIIKVTGRIKKEDNTNSYKGISGLYSTYKYYYDNSGEHTGVDPYVNRWDTIFDLDNKDTASADLTISVVNPANKIKFKKVDPQGQAIRPEADKQAAQFLLYKNDGTIERPNENWSEVEKAKDVDEDGIITYEKLEKGYYKLVETTAPKGYIKPTDPVAYFKVDETGKIYKEITITKEDGTTEKIYEEVEGTIPINIVNNKPIEFEKVDANDNTNKLEGAVFKVLYKEKETDKYSDYEVNGGVLKVTSGEDGKLKLNLTKSGYYALEETTAPEGYSKLPGYIKEFKLENGKAQILEKSIEKISQRTSSKGLMTSEILSVNKEDNTFTQRIVINPNHGKLNVKDNNSSLNILENGWRVINRKSGKIGGQVRVALIKEAENKRIADLKDDDYNSYYAIGSGYASLGNDIVYRYGLKEMLGLETTSESITTTDTMVIEYTGKLNNVNEIGQKLVVELSDFENDSLDYNLNPDKLADNKATYVDRIQEDPIQIENKKVSLPNTNGLAAWIGFTILGLIFMTLAGFYYNKKKNLA